MNQFRTSGKLCIVILALGLLACILYPHNLSASNPEVDDLPVPKFQLGTYLYADIDSEGQRVFIAMNGRLWQYDLKSEQWQSLLSLDSINEPIANLEFGYNQHTGNVNFWSRGVGRMYVANLETGQVRRVDNSFDHRNQFAHTPFYRDSTVYAFGGYGFWRWQNIITFYHPDLREWMLQNVATGSPLPDGRNAYTGEYAEQEDALYIYGGKIPVNGHPDDQNVEMETKSDIWKFSFKTNKWEKLLTLDAASWSFYEVNSLKQVNRINAIASSFYSDSTGIWYLPTTNTDNKKSTIFLKPINTRTITEYERVQFYGESYSHLLPMHFLFDDKNRRMIMLGIEDLADADSSSVKVIKVPEKVLLDQISTSPRWASNLLYYVFGGVLMISLLGYYVVRRRHSETESESTSNIPVPLTEVLLHDIFSDQEKDLLQFLAEEGRYLETQSIEERLWGKVDNYDYRRRLRNDIIKSINDKFRSHYNTDKKLINREKDADDKRRYLYGLNKKSVYRESGK